MYVIRYIPPRYSGSRICFRSRLRTRGEDCALIEVARLKPPRDAGAGLGRVVTEAAEEEIHSRRSSILTSRPKVSAFPCDGRAVIVQTVRPQRGPRSLFRRRRPGGTRLSGPRVLRGRSRSPGSEAAKAGSGTFASILTKNAWF